MKLDSEQQIINLSLLGLLTTWMFKITFHFNYLRSIGTVRESNLVSFFLNLENLSRTILIVSPFFSLKKKDKKENDDNKEKRLTLSAYALCIMFAVASYYLYNHSPKE